MFWLSFCKHLLSLSLLLSSAHTQTPVQAPAPAPAQQPEDTIRVGAEEVLLDLVVRDKKGRAVRDFKESEIEVYEDGVKKQITSFRAINRLETDATAENKTSNPAQSAVRPVNSAGPDPSRQINLVTMVFERLNTQGRTLAKEAALEFIKNELGPNVMIAVFSLDQRISVLQHFTADRNKLKAAIERAASSAASQFADQSEQIRRELENQTNSQAQADSAVSGTGQGGASNVSGGSFAAAKLAEITVNVLRATDDAQRQQQGSASIYGLLSLVREQQRLGGRKTVLYFSEGLQVPPNLSDAFKTTISAANRANVSFYAIDARGLDISRQTEEAKAALEAAVSASQQQQRTRGGQAVTREQAMAFDTAEASIGRNLQQNLASLAESTGGFLIANTNDLRTPMNRVATELLSYYEATYNPDIREYDGSFRRITVKSLRPDVIVQTRNGYFALPPMEGTTLLPYELPLLASLGTKPLPREFEYRAQAMHFAVKPGSVQQMMVVEVPLSNLSFQTDSGKKIYRTHCSLMMLVKNAEGRVVYKSGQDFPLDGPLQNLERLKKGNLVFTRYFWLPPGRYTMETIAQDRESKKLSARRSILMVPRSTSGLHMSSLTVIKRIDPVAAEAQDTEHPWRFRDGKIIPNLNDPIKTGAGSELPIHLVVYPAGGSSEKPVLTLDFLIDGEIVARAQPELPSPDKEGVIAWIAKVPSESFKPGRYEIRAVVRQGQQAVEEHAFFTIE